MVFHKGQERLGRLNDIWVKQNLVYDGLDVGDCKEDLEIGDREATK
jgi:hypothetical protein